MKLRDQVTTHQCMTPGCSRTFEKKRYSKRSECDVCLKKAQRAGFSRNKGTGMLVPYHKD